MLQTSMVVLSTLFHLVVGFWIRPLKLAEAARLKYPPVL